MAFAARMMPSISPRTVACRHATPNMRNFSAEPGERHRLVRPNQLPCALSKQSQIEVGVAIGNILRLARALKLIGRT